MNLPVTPDVPTNSRESVPSSAGDQHNAIEGTSEKKTSEFDRPFTIADVRKAREILLTHNVKPIGEYMVFDLVTGEWLHSSDVL